MGIRQVRPNVRLGREAEWLSSRLILRLGEQGIAEDMQILKWGNGVDRWPDLEPIWLNGLSPISEGNAGNNGGSVEVDDWPNLTLLFDNAKS